MTLKKGRVCYNSLKRRLYNPTSGILASCRPSSFSPIINFHVLSVEEEDCRWDVTDVEVSRVDGGWVHIHDVDRRHVTQVVGGFGQLAKIMRTLVIPDSDRLKRYNNNNNNKKYIDSVGVNIGNDWHARFASMFTGYNIAGS